MAVQVGEVAALFRYPVKSIRGEAVEAADVGRRLGGPVEMMHRSRGIFDEASVSLLLAATVDEVARLAG